MMTLRLLLIGILAAWPISMVAGDTVISDSGPATAPAGVSNPQRAEMNWAVGCRGCHRADASGTPNGAPNMAGLVARFLSVEGGREYLVRVPGVAFSSLGDDELAELVNWMLYRFDREHVPVNFKPYTAEEVGALRGRPLVSDARDTRQELLDYLDRADTSEAHSAAH